MHREAQRATARAQAWYIMVLVEMLENSEPLAVPRLQKGRPHAPEQEPRVTEVPPFVPYPTATRGAAVHDGALPQPRDVGEARVRTLEHIPKKIPR